MVIKAASLDNIDVTYFCKWNDMCHLYEYTIITTSPQHFQFVKTRSPNGLQAIMFSRSGLGILYGEKMMRNREFFMVEGDLDKSLNREIYNGNIRAAAIVPNLIEFNINTSASNNKDYEKMNACVPIIMNSVEHKKGVNGAWIIVFIFFILLLGWAILKIGRCR